MRKSLAVATASLTAGLLLGYGVHAGATTKAAPCTDKASQAAVTRFITATLGKGQVALPPVGCTDQLMIQIWLQLHATNQSWEQMNVRVATLEGHINRICPELTRVSTSAGFIC